MGTSCGKPRIFRAAFRDRPTSDSRCSPMEESNVMIVLISGCGRTDGLQTPKVPAAGISFSGLGDIVVHKMNDCSSRHAAESEAYLPDLREAVINLRANAEAPRQPRKLLHLRHRRVAYRVIPAMAGGGEHQGFGKTGERPLLTVSPLRWGEQAEIERAPPIGDTSKALDINE